MPTKRRIEVTEHQVRLSGLPRDAEGLRIVQLCDLHVGPLFRDRAVRHALSVANRSDPDLIVLTGDLVSYRSMKYLVSAAREFRALRAPLGVFGCLGNHDHWESAADVRSILEESGVRVLINENHRVYDGLWLAGIDDLMSGEPDLERMADGIPTDAAVVLLSHNPTVLSQVADRPWLILAGHSHGGQIALPFLGPRRTARLPGIRSFMYLYEWSGVRARGARTETISTYRYPAGWYEEGQARVYVNRGVGFSQAFPIRINCPPEVACFTLRAHCQDPA